MALALREAGRAAEEGEIPVGCVLVGTAGEIVSQGHNLREQLRDVTAHAEIVALRRAAQATGAWRCDRMTAYVTLEPCPMCASALLQARIGRVVYACDDPKGGALHSLFLMGEDARLNHQFDTTRGVASDAARTLIERFFKQLRLAGKK